MFVTYTLVSIDFVNSQRRPRMRRLITAVRASDAMTASCKTLTSGLGLDDMSLAWPAVVQLLVFIYSGIQ